uniref:C2 domain-containing protein n=1 Tax=Lutzomyia longipalpis TaxID=7200 RepID=A0A1B0CS86_LUTLO
MSGQKFKEKIHERFIMKKREATMSHSPTNIPIPASRRISAVYLREETEIQKILHSQPPPGEGEMTQTEREIAFFTTAISAEDEEPEYTDVQQQSDGNLTEVSERSLHSGSPGPGRDIQESPTHLASSYVQMDDHMPLFERVKIPFVYDRELLTTFDESWRLSRPNVESTVRNVEEEGLYRPDILMSQRKMQWFDQMAEERAQNADEPNDVRPFLEIPELPNPENIPTVFLCLKEENLSYSPYMLDHKILTIHISKIHFAHHPLFSEEHVLAQRVEDLFHAYRELQKSDLAGKYRQSLITLRRLTKELQKDSKSDQNASKLAKHREELQKTRNKLHEEEQKVRENLKDLLSEYRKLKNLREKQKFNLTTTKLAITAIETSKEGDEAAFERDFNEELEELIEEAFQEYLDEKKKYKELVKSIKEDDKVPDPIEKPNSDEIKKNLQEIYSKTRRGVGEPIVTVALSKIERSDAKNNPKEVNRIRKLENTKFLIKISLNDDVVDIVRDLHSDDRFEIAVNTSISVRLIRKLPEKIKLQIFEAQTMIPRFKIASIALPLPEDRDLYDDCPIRTFPFINDRDVPSDVGVGSGKFCQIEGIKDLYTRGKIYLKIGWAQKGEKDDHQSEIQDLHVRAAARKWRDSHWDPLDPENDFTSMHHIDDRSNATVDQIPLMDIQDDEKLTFCPPEVVENNTRLNLLIERARLTAQFKDMKLIPQEEREIQLRKDSKIIDETLGMDPIDLSRHQGKKAILKIFSNIAQINEIANRENEDSRLLFREDAPSLRALGVAILGFLGTKRPLKPMIKRNQSLKPTCRLDDCDKFTITVNVARAFGIPSRTDDPPQSVRRSSNLSSTQQSAFRTVNVRPYVVVSFKDKTARTSTAEGSNPTWNEQLQIPINLKMDQLKGHLCIQLFDEYIDDLLEDDRIEGTFELNSPKILLGYSKASLNPGSLAMFSENLPDTRGPIYLSLFVGLEPNFDIPYFTTRHLECIESDQVKATIQYWCMEFSNEFPHRFADPLVTLSTGKRVTVTKLLGSLEIPFDLREASSDCLIRRFVSLIPVLQTTDPCSQLTGDIFASNCSTNILTICLKMIALGCQKSIRGSQGNGLEN